MSLIARRIFGPKRDGVTGGWTKLRNEELYDGYSSPSIVMTMKGRRVILSGHVVRMGEATNTCFDGKLKNMRLS
jgi:hypothetical protein